MATLPRILIVENDESARVSLALILKREGYAADLAVSGEEAVAFISGGEPYDLVITDLVMGRVGGLEVLEAVKQARRESEVILLTGFGSVETAVEAMKRGAYEYLTKPYDPDELVLTVAKALERRQLKREVKQLREQVRATYRSSNIVGKSARLKQVHELIESAAPTDATILVQGESGSGKELVARAVHANSQRASGPFVAINCGALPETLLESELFGHVKGAFTGAQFNKPGLFEEASGGTIFLDEIGETTPATQVKLLRVLQEQEVRRVGDTKTVKVNARVVAATNTDLMGLVREGKFREDLYYRLNVIAIEVPPLRERIEDLPLLVRHFLEKYGEKTGRGQKEVAPQAMALLEGYPWPGNIRELENTIERAVILSKTPVIGPSDLPPQVRAGHETRGVGTGFEPGSLTLDELERTYIVTSLERFAGNQAATASALGISRTTLWRKLKAYGLSEQVGTEPAPAQD
jgi:DNA-binding NtrC family response regulator